MKLFGNALLLALVLHASLAFALDAPTTFTNPRLTRNSPDPWVMRHTDATYYGTFTTGRNLTLWRSKSLSGLFTAGERKVIWTPPRSGWNTRDIWAPELHRIQGKWYVYYSANLRTGVIENENADPFGGAWIERGRIFSPDAPNAGAIDGTILEQQGKLYFIWSGFDGKDQCLFISAMSNPWTLTGHRVRLSRPTLDWEVKGDHPVNEGPEILKRNGRTFLVYSASICHTRYYCLGMLTAADTSDPLDPKSWTKSAKPVFESSDANGTYSVGHNGFTTSPDGREDWIIYHASFGPGNDLPRLTCMQKFTWNPDGTPNFGVPEARGKALQVPSGETK